MEQGGRRRAFGSICPNRVQGPPARLAKKPARPSREEAGIPPATASPHAPPPRPRRSAAPPAPAAPALVLTTIDWQDLAACAPTLPITPAGPVTLQQGPCSQDVPEFDFQEFRDAVDYFVSDASTSAPPPMDCADFDFSLGEEVAFGPRTPQLESSRLVQTPPQRLPSPEPCWGQLVDQYQKALGDSPEANSQLQTTLTQRQVKLSTPHESTVQLKELATQARQLAAVLETMTLPQCADGAAIPPPLHPSPPRPGPAGTWGGCVQSEPRESVAGVDAMLRDVSEKCHAALRTLRGSGGGTPGGIPGGSPVGSPTAKRPRPAPRLHGAFHGLHTVRDAPRPGGGRLEAGGSLRMALGEEDRMRTLSFPQGNAFTLRTAGGGYRFCWVPR